MTLRKMTFNITTLNIMTFNIMAFNVMTFNITAFSIRTFLRYAQHKQHSREMTLSKTLYGVSLCSVQNAECRISFIVMQNVVVGCVIMMNDVILIVGAHLYIFSQTQLTEK